MGTEYVETLFSLQGKTAVITGGGGTLGSAMGSGFARVGANVILWDVREDALKEKVDRLRTECGDAKRIHFVTVDLMDEDATRGALAESVRKYGAVDILLKSNRWHRRHRR